jgi:hypothetical protein
MGFRVNIISEARRKRDREDEDRRAAQRTFEWMVKQGDIGGIRAMEKDFKKHGIEITPEMKMELVTDEFMRGALRAIGGQEAKRMHPSETYSRRMPTGETEYFARVPETEQIRKRTEVTQEAVAEGVVSGKVKTRERRQQLALDERTSKLGVKLFDQELDDAAALQRQKGLIDLEFSLPPHEDQFDQVGNQIRYDYKYNEKKAKWEIDKTSGRVIRYAVTEGDKLAIKREVVRMMSELRKVDAIDYNDAMKMMVVEALKETKPKLAKEIAKMEIATAQGKLKLKQAIGMYINDLIASGEFTAEEIKTLKATEKVGTDPTVTAPAADWIPDPNNPGRMIQAQ